MQDENQLFQTKPLLQIHYFWVLSGVEFGTHKIHDVLTLIAFESQTQI